MINETRMGDTLPCLDAWRFSFTTQLQFFQLQFGDYVWGGGKGRQGLCPNGYIVLTLVFLPSEDKDIQLWDAHLVWWFSTSTPTPTSLFSISRTQNFTWSAMIRCRSQISRHFSQQQFFRNSRQTLCVWVDDSVAIASFGRFLFGVICD